MEVETISRDCIKPSSPTPLHLKSYELCLLDQYQNHQYLSLFLYDPLNLSGAAANIDLILSNRLQLLKQSLSETLVQYYAGNLTEIYSIDCKDEGIYFQGAVASPMYDASSLFPPHDAYPRELNELVLATRFCRIGRFVTKRFVFETKAIAELKTRATSSSVQNPTRVEVVSALLAKCIMAAVKIKSGSHKPIFLTHAVNLRRKAKPPLSEHLVGNIIYHVNTLCTDNEVEFGDLVCQLREAITRFDGDFVKVFKVPTGFVSCTKEIKDEAEVYAEVKDRILFTGWCSFKGFCDINFEWGKPIWVSVAGFGGSTISIYPYIVLMNTRLGDGIEAWVNFLEDNMYLLQFDKQLLAFATLDPSPSG